VCYLPRLLKGVTWLTQICYITCTHTHTHTHTHAHTLTRTRVHEHASVGNEPSKPGSFMQKTWHVIEPTNRCSVLHCVAVCGSVLQCIEPTNRCYSITAKCNTCVVVCCSVLQCSEPTNRCRSITAKCNIRVLYFSVLQCVAVCCSESSLRIITTPSQRNAISECCSVLHCIAVCGSMLQFVEPTNRCYSITANCNTCVVVCCSVLQCSEPTNRCHSITAKCNMLQCVAVCCSVLSLLIVAIPSLRNAKSECCNVLRGTGVYSRLQCVEPTNRCRPITTNCRI